MVSYEKEVIEYEADKRSLFTKDTSLLWCWFNKSDYNHIYDMYKLYMNDKLDKFKKVTVTGYDDGHKLFTCDIDIDNLRHNYYTIIHYYMTNLELMIMKKDMFK